jgi:hypothetical protein
MTQTKRDTMVLQTGVGCGAKHKPINMSSFENILRRGQSPARTEMSEENEGFNHK